VSADVSLHSLAQTLVQKKQARIHPLSEAEQLVYHNVNTPDDL
jgi:hypothetical protein